MTLSAKELGYEKLNEAVRHAAGEIQINDCFGERFIGCGAADKTITINGTPGNAMGAYLNGATMIVKGNAQDAVGDTMNAGRIVIHGNAGDALGYAMRGGEIYVKGSAGYRAGIHMKEYMEKRPLIVIGGSTGSFLGEYLAGGLMIVLGLDTDQVPVGNFTGTGMHGGHIWIRSSVKPTNLPAQVCVEDGRPPGDPALYRELCKAVRGFCGNHSGKALLPAEPQRQEPLQAAVYSELTAIPHRCCGVFPTFRRCCR